MALIEKIAPALSYFVIDLTDKIEEKLVQYDITMRQYLLLADIYRKDGILMKDLMALKPYKAVFYRDLNYLHSKKMLTKRKGRKYKKNIYLHLTAYGESIVFDVNEVIEKFILESQKDLRKIKCMINFLNKYSGSDTI
jgi:DNA-binding MarR family transcriptional regulator